MSHTKLRADPVVQQCTNLPRVFPDPDVRRVHDSLPRLPLNDLQATADRYLYAATPLISGTELETTKKIMNDFVAGDGKKLHEFIVEREKTRYSSFISEPWFDMYLTTRDPLPLNINPQMTFFNDPIEAKNEQVTRAALLAWCSARFYRTLKDEKLPPDLFHTQRIAETKVVPTIDTLICAARCVFPPSDKKACMGGTGTGFFSFLNGKGGSSQVPPLKLPCACYAMSGTDVAHGISVRYGVLNDAQILRLLRSPYPLPPHPPLRLPPLFRSISISRSLAVLLALAIIRFLSRAMYFA
eukprot:2623692-Rhodomonas_salina.3